MEINKRDNIIDNSRGIGIILVVIGHCMPVFGRYIYLFHMALFFYLSGYCYNEKNNQNITTLFFYFKKKIEKLYIPFVLFNVIYLCLHNIFYSIHFYHTPDFWETNQMCYLENSKEFFVQLGKILCFSHIEQLLAPFWFLPILFFCNIIFAIISYLWSRLKKGEEIRFFVIFILFLTACSVGPKNNKVLRLFTIGFLVLLIYYIGFLVKKYYINLYFNKLIFLSSGLFLWICCNFGRIDVAALSFVSPPFFILCSLAGIYCVLYLSYKIPEKITLVANIGKESIFIMALHFTAFKVVSFIIIILKGFSFEYLAYPIVQRNGFSGAFYCIIGVFLPYIIKRKFNVLRDMLKKKKINSNESNI